MKTWQIYLIAGIIVVLGVVAMVVLRRNTEPATNNGEQTNQVNESTNNSNEQKPMSDYDIKNKFVTLSVEGFGDIKIQLYDEDSPKTVENFLRLTEKGYYNGLTFHRIAKGFVVQGGDPTGTGSGGESAFGGEFEDELDPNTPSAKAGYKKGVVAMANRGPNTNTSQFFIMLADNDLPHNYTIFGKVVAGLDVVDKIGAVGVTPQMGPTDGTPVQKITITKAVISGP
jgi:cyclophilin family peptidyl-prolyl cis-trans isomerase